MRALLAAIVFNHRVFGVVDAFILNIVLSWLFLQNVFGITWKSYGVSIWPLH